MKEKQGSNSASLTKNVFNKELQKRIIQAKNTKEVLPMPPSPFKNLQEFREMFDNINGNKGIIKTPYKDIVVDINYAFKHFTRNTYNKDRQKVKGGFFSTFREPLFVVEKEKGENISTYFYKPFYDEQKNLVSLFGIGVNKNGSVDFKTYYSDESGSRLREILESKDVRIKFLKE